MSLPDITQADSPEQLLAGLDAYITQAHALLEAKQMVELAGLDSVVSALCKRVLAIPTEEARPYAVQLDALHARLGELQQAMEQAQRAIREEMQATQQRQRASRAYQTNEG